MRVSDHPETLSCLPSSPGQTPGFSSRVYPATSGPWRHSVASGCTGAVRARSIKQTVSPGQRANVGVSGGCGIRTHEAIADLAAFKAAALVHYANPPVRKPR
jgi:hypothetical protein